MTYLEAISAWQQRGIDTIKVAQSTQITSLRTALDCSAALSAPRSPVSLIPSFVSDVTALVAVFTCQVLEQQVAYAKQLVDTIAAPTSAGSAHEPALANSRTASPLALPEAKLLPELPPPVAELMLASAEPMESGAISAEPMASEAVSAEPMASEALSAEPMASEALSTEPMSGNPMSTDSTGDTSASEAVFQTPELVAEAPVETQATVLSVSDDFSTVTQPAKKSPGSNVKPVPASSAHASAKPPKATSVSSERAVKRGSKPK